MRVSAAGPSSGRQTEARRSRLQCGNGANRNDKQGGGRRIFKSAVDAVIGHDLIVVRRQRTDWLLPEYFIALTDISIRMTVEVTQKTHPRMHPVFENRDDGWRKVSVSKTTYGNCDQLRCLLQGIEDSSPAIRTKVKPDLIAAIGNADELTAFAFYTHGLSRKSCLRTKYAPRALLTIVAMTNRNPHWIAIHLDVQAPTGARCLSLHFMLPLVNRPPTHARHDLASAKAACP